MSIDRSNAVDEITRNQHGLITTEQAMTALGPSRKSRWVTEGRLISVQPSVFRMAGSPETWHQSVLAAALAVDGIVSHRSAAELWGLIQPAGYAEVSVPGDQKRKVRPPAIVHRILDLHPDLAVDRAGLRTTDAVRTVIDLGLVIPWWLVHRVIAKGLSTHAFELHEVKGFRDALGRPGRNGTGVVREILEGNLLIMDNEESELEKRFNALVRRRGLPALTLAARGVVGRALRRADRRRLPATSSLRSRSTASSTTRARTRFNGIALARTSSSRSAGRSCGSPGPTSSSVPPMSPGCSSRRSRGSPRDPDVCASITVA